MKSTKTKHPLEIPSVSLLESELARVKVPTPVFARAEKYDLCADRCCCGSGFDRNALAAVPAFHVADAGGWQYCAFRSDERFADRRYRCVITTTRFWLSA